MCAKSLFNAILKQVVVKKSDCFQKELPKHFANYYLLYPIFNFFSPSAVDEYRKMENSTWFYLSLKHCVICDQRCAEFDDVLL